LKIQPNNYVPRYRSGSVVAEGAGLSYFYYGPTTSLASIPISSTDAPFIFEDVTSDYQTITIQGPKPYGLQRPWWKPFPP
jgi:hypothetical protein